LDFIVHHNNSISEICGDRMENSCNTVQNSEYSKISLIQNNDYSIPISLLGVIFYFIVLFLSLLGIYLNKKKSLGKKYQYSLIVITTLGIIFSIIFTLVQAILIRAFCTLCIISAINTLIIFILSLGFIILYNKNKY